MGKESPIIIPGEQKFDPKFEGKPSGVVILDGQEVAHTMQCKHCGGHFVSIKGSGIERGWCTKCKGVTCGKVDCDPCIPFGHKLDFTDSQNPSLVKRLMDRFPKIKKL